MRQVPVSVLAEAITMMNVVSRCNPQSLQKNAETIIRKRT
jgi:hypothetical protein